MERLGQKEVKRLIEVEKLVEILKLVGVTELEMTKSRFEKPGETE